MRAIYPDTCGYCWGEGVRGGLPCQHCKGLGRLRDERFESGLLQLRLALYLETRWQLERLADYHIRDCGSGTRQSWLNAWVWVALEDEKSWIEEIIEVGGAQSLEEL